MNTLRMAGYRSIVKNRINDVGKGIVRVAMFIKNNINGEEIRNRRRWNGLCRNKDKEYRRMRESGVDRDI